MIKTLAVLTALCAVPALAIAAPHGGHEAAHHGSSADLIPFWINFSLYVVVLFVLVRKPIASGWASRRDGIAAAVNKGKVERDQAESALRIAKGKESMLSSDIAALLAQVKNDTKAETEEVLRDAHERASRISAQGKDLLTAEQKAFETSLRKELADEVLKRATEILKKDMNASSDAALRTSSLNTVGQLLN